MLPGYESNRLDEPTSALEEQNEDSHRRVNEARLPSKDILYVSNSEMQDFYYSMSKVKRVFGSSAMNRAKGGESCHNKQDRSGKPAATAVDIWGKPYGAFIAWKLDIHFNEHIRFFNALGKVVADVGLEWGGRWTSQHSIGQSMGWVGILRIFRWVGASKHFASVVFKRFCARGKNTIN